MAEATFGIVHPTRSGVHFNAFSRTGPFDKNQSSCTYNYILDVPVMYKKLSCSASFTKLVYDARSHV